MTFIKRCNLFGKTYVSSDDISCWWWKKSPLTESWFKSQIMTWKLKKKMTYCLVMNSCQVVMKIMKTMRELLQKPKKWFKLMRSFSMPWKNLTCHKVKKLKKLLLKLREKQMTQWLQGKQYSWCFLIFQWI